MIAAPGTSRDYTSTEETYKRLVQFVELNRKRDYKEYAGIAGACLFVWLHLSELNTSWGELQNSSLT